MAGYRATMGILQALRESMSQRMKKLLGGNPSVVQVGYHELNGTPVGENLGIYLYRFSVDPFARNRYLPPSAGRRTPRPELPVNLHILLIAWCNGTESEIAYLSAAMQIIGSAMNLGISQVGISDPGWGEADSVQIIPEEMSTEDLSRLWESFPGSYRLSVPYIIKTVRFAPDEEQSEEPLVKTLVYPFARREVAP
jgi:hypothetical protein